MPTIQRILRGLPGKALNPGAWPAEDRRHVEHELGRRKRAQKRREKGAGVIHSDAGQKGDGSV